MLLIQQLYTQTEMKSDYVKCPACKKGRLCDKPANEKVQALAITGNTERSSFHKLILKCPRCAQKFLISISIEI